MSKLPQLRALNGETGEWKQQLSETRRADPLNWAFDDCRWSVTATESAFKKCGRPFFRRILSSLHRKLERRKRNAHVISLSTIAPLPNC